VNLSIGSLFSGIGGLELGLEWAGVGHTAWQVEQSPFCRAILAKHWPDATRYEDVKNVGRSNLAPVDVICGGFPCQDISLAGKGAGLAGERSGLWSEYARIVRELRPRYVVVENVSALLNRGLDVVLGELAASGYDAWWDCIPASAVGAPHRRDRLFVVAYANDKRVHTEQISRRECEAEAVSYGHGAEGIVSDIGRRTGNSRAQGGVTDALRTRLEGQRQVAERISAEQPDASDRGWWLIEPNVGRVANGIPGRVDRLKSLGNAVVPQVAEVIGRLIVAHAEQNSAERAA